jgi:hypothetical protein
LGRAQLVAPGLPQHGGEQRAFKGGQSRIIDRARRGDLRAQPMRDSAGQIAGGAASGLLGARGAASIGSARQRVDHIIARQQRQAIDGIAHAHIAAPG